MLHRNSAAGWADTFKIIVAGNDPAKRLKKWSSDYEEFVFLSFDIKSTGNTMRDPVVHIDNVSFKVTGTQKVPAMQGKIAYYEKIGEEVKAIKILDPNHRRTKIIYSDSFLEPDLKWRPDGAEIAFVSGKENRFSFYYGDIFAIRPDGTQLRKITNQPSYQEMITGDYPRVTLTGSILNSTRLDSGIATIRFCPQGAKDCIFGSIRPGDSYEFSIPDVAVLDDPEVYSQYAVMHWLNTHCNIGQDLALFNAPVVNGVANLGVISFSGSLCLNSSSNSINDILSYNMDDHKLAHISWKNDTSQIVGDSALKLQAWDSITGKPFGGQQLPSGGNQPSHMDWSPVDDRYLYTA